MIPRKIHYCWFGRNPLPESALKCIASWRKYFPDYEIIEWNEDNFDVNSIPYTAEAYAAKKYAFVSDYARFKILYDHGGLYFDTDVEVIKAFDDILSRGPFMGVEVGISDKKGYKRSTKTLVAPGLGLGAHPKMQFYNIILSHYATQHFICSDGSLNTQTVGEHTTSELLAFGLRSTPVIQKICGIYIYPPEWFNPLDDSTGKLRLTSETVSIHWYNKSWIENQSPFRVYISRLSHRIFGLNLSAKLKKIIIWK